MSVWEEHDIEVRGTAILSEAEGRPDLHNFGYPFLTAYQIAIEFDTRHPEIRQELDYPLGGKDKGERVSLSQYLARELSRRINSEEIARIEGRFLSNQHLNDISFTFEGWVIQISLTDSQYPLSMFYLLKAYMGMYPMRLF